MKINGNGYNNYLTNTSTTPIQNGEDTNQPHEGSALTEPASPRTITTTDPGQQETSDVSNPQKQQAPIDSQLSQAELQLLTELKQIDTEIRSHEMAHVAAGGGLISSGTSFTYKRGPDGNNYAVAGEVSIDTSAVPGDPQATLQKMQQVKNSALAPASPSAQDLKVASRATAMATKANSDLLALTAKEQAGTNENQAFGNLKQASDSYIKVNGLPEKDDSTFKLAV
ncbi:MAG: SprA-related family protein [Desulfobacteraceae bacterium]|nr:SprA-related family protein [Desulfobacteraceae bacterium]